METENKIKNTTKKGRVFPKFYVLDVAIIILILASILGIYFRYNLFDTLGNVQSKDQAAIEFRVENIKETTKTYISIDDNVYFKNDGRSFGTIMPYEENSNEALRTSYTSATFVENGNTITVSYPAGENARIDANGKIKCKGAFGDDGSFKLNGTEYLSAGQTMTICTELVTLEITILKIEKIVD